VSPTPVGSNPTPVGGLHPGIGPEAEEGLPQPVEPPKTLLADGSGTIRAGSDRQGPGSEARSGTASLPSEQASTEESASKAGGRGLQIGRRMAAEEHACLGGGWERYMSISRHVSAQ